MYTTSFFFAINMSAHVPLRVMTYNVYLTVPKPIKYNGQMQRAKKIVPGIRQWLPKLDVVVFNEIAIRSAYLVIRRHMHNEGFKHCTSPMKGTAGLTNSGVAIFSKYRLHNVSYTFFQESCSGADCLATKGFTYTYIKKHNMRIHLIGTHLQAWSSQRAVRDEQLRKITRFIKDRRISRHEPLVIMGDLNMNVYDTNTLDTLSKHRLKAPRIISPVTNSPVFTVHNGQNKLVGNDDPASYTSTAFPNGCADEYYTNLTCPCCPNEWLDYTLCHADHLLPTHSFMEVVIPNVAPYQLQFTATKTMETTDISDHYPVLGTFVFNKQYVNTELASPPRATLSAGSMLFYASLGALAAFTIH